MRKTKLAIATSTVVGLSALASQDVHAGSASNSATANIVSDITVSSKQPMQFGDVLVTGTGNTGTAELDSGRDVTTTGGVSAVGGSPQPAEFTLKTSETAESNQTITVNATALANADSATHTLPWRSLNASYDGANTVHSTGTSTGLEVKITGASVPTSGATLRAYGGVEVQSGDPIGTYIGKVTVTANRE